MRTLSECHPLDQRDLAVLRACKERIEDVVPGSGIILYGSRARGEASRQSDYDLLVVSSAPVTDEVKDRVRNPIYDLELEIGCLISTLIYDRKTWDSPLFRATGLHRAIDREGVVL